MTLNRNRLYPTLFIACIAGYLWLYLSINMTQGDAYNVCLIKHFTNIPCPSCGTTRSIFSLYNGNFINALRINPLGLLVAAIMVLAPLWILIDVVTKRKTLFELYKKIETYLNKPQYSIPLILLVIANWIWNVTKAL